MIHSTVCRDEAASSTNIMTVNTISLCTLIHIFYMRVYGRAHKYVPMHPSGFTLPSSPLPAVEYSIGLYTLRKMMTTRLYGCPVLIIFTLVRLYSVVLFFCFAFFVVRFSFYPPETVFCPPPPNRTYRSSFSMIHRRPFRPFISGARGFVFIRHDEQPVRTTRRAGGHRAVFEIRAIVVFSRFFFSVFCFIVLPLPSVYPSVNTTISTGNQKHRRRFPIVFRIPALSEISRVRRNVKGKNQNDGKIYASPVFFFFSIKSIWFFFCVYVCVCSFVRNKRERRAIFIERRSYFL